MAAFGIKAIQPEDNEHILGFAAARDTTDESLFEVWNGPDSSDLVYTLDKGGQHQGASGSASRPTYSFEADKDSGRYMSGAGTFLDVIAGTAVGTWTAGKLTLTELQVDNLNINTNTISSTSGAVNIVPVSGSAILLDGTISIDAGVVTGATSITSTAFVGDITGAVTGTASLATSITATANNSTDETVYPTFVDGATGTQGIETDTGLTYNPSSGILTGTRWTGAVTGEVTGNAATATALATARNIGGTSFDGTANIAVALATLATTVTITDNESTNEDNALIFTAGGDVDGGSLGLESDGTLTYNPSTGKVTATGFIGTLTGTASTATVATTVTITDNESTNEDNALIFTAGGDVDGGNIGLESDGTLTYNPSTGKVTATGFIGALTGNADTATLATTVTITDNESTDEDNAVIFTAGGDVDGGNLGLESDGTFHYNPSDGLVTATAFAGALTGNVTGNCSGSALTVTQAAQTAITSVGTLTSVAVGNITSTGNFVTTDTGPHSFGASVSGVSRMQLAGAFTSDGSSSILRGLNMGGALTGASGDTTFLLGQYYANSIVTQTATEDIAVIAQAYFVEPAITDNLTGDITTAATVYIASAPSEGETNAGLYVNASSYLASRVDHATGATLSAQYGSGNDIGLNTSSATTDFNIKCVGEFAVSAGASSTTNFLIAGTAASFKGTLDVTSDLTTAADLVIGTNPSSAGTVRLPKNFGVKSRNQANDGDLLVMTENHVTGTGSLEFGDNSGSTWTDMRFHVSTGNVMVLTSTLIALNKATTMNNAAILMTGLATSDPGVAGQLWRSGNDVKISTG